MLSFAFSEYLSPTAIVADLQNNSGLALICLLATTWLLWRLWRFEILPLIYPDDPKELPYWIPSKCC